jgi:hypothetical protein
MESSGSTSFLQVQICTKGVPLVLFSVADPHSLNPDSNRLVLVKLNPYGTYPGRIFYYKNYPKIKLKNI